MTNNEEQDYQEQDNQDETATSAEETKTEEQKGQEETKDWKAEALKYKAIAERKEKKLQNQPEEKSGEDLKTNQGQETPTLEHMELFSQGATKEKIEYAQKYASIEGISLTEAYNSDICQSKFEAMDQEKREQANSIKPSSGSPQVQPEKTSGEMTDEEHRKWAQEKLGNVKSM